MEAAGAQRGRRACGQHCLLARRARIRREDRMSALRVGWIGCGTHANEMLLPQLIRHDVRIAALCDVDDGRLNKTAERYGARETTKDWRALLARQDIDALGIAAGPTAHFEIGIAALGLGLPLFIEKPPAPTAKDAEILAAAAEKAGKPVVLGFMKRYSTANR